MNPKMFMWWYCLYFLTDFHSRMNPLPITVLSVMEKRPISNRHLPLVNAGPATKCMEWSPGLLLEDIRTLDRRRWGKKVFWMDKIQHKLFGSCETETNWKVAETWGQCAITRSKPYCPSSQFNLWEELLKYISPYYFNKQTARRPTVFANEVKCERKNLINKYF